jgi:hypothetical protein
VVVRWLLLFALPILLCVVLFQALLVTAEDLQLNLFAGGHAYGAPFIVGVGRVPGTPVEGPAPLPPERFSVLWFAVDVVLTAAFAVVIAWFLRIRNAWPTAVMATGFGLLMMRDSSHPPIPVGSYGFSLWISWLVTFALAAAIWTAFELYRARRRQR